MKIINFGETNSILNQYVSEIRNVEVQNDRLRFRRNIERIGEIMAYEMSKEFTYSTKTFRLRWVLLLQILRITESLSVQFFVQDFLSTKDS